MNELISGPARQPFDWFSEIPGAAGYLFEVVFAGVSLAIVWGSDGRAGEGSYVYFVFGIYFTLIYSVTSHWIWSPTRLAVRAGMQDFAGSTVVHYQGALAALAGALLARAADRQVRDRRPGEPDPGTQHPYAVLGTLILWFGSVSVQPARRCRSTSAVSATSPTSR